MRRTCALYTKVDCGRIAALESEVTVMGSSDVYGRRLRGAPATLEELVGRLHTTSGFPTSGSITRQYCQQITESAWVCLVRQYKREVGQAEVVNFARCHRPARRRRVTCHIRGTTMLGFCCAGRVGNGYRQRRTIYRIKHQSQRRAEPRAQAHSIITSPRSSSPPCSPPWLPSPAPSSPSSSHPQPPSAAQHPYPRYQAC